MKTLKTVLLINALSSGATGLGLVVSSSLIAQLFGTTASGYFIEVEIFLVAFGTLVFFVSLGKEYNTNAVRLIITLDVLWVVISLAIVLLQSFDLSMIGYLAISVVALWVGTMAYLQTIALKQLIASK
jgi:hypothetical protein